MAKFEYSESDIESLFKGIFDGSIDPESLPEDFYLACAEYLTKGLYKGFGEQLSDIKFGTPDFELADELRTNIYMFSAARTFQQTVEMSDELVDDDGSLHSWQEFRDKARDIYEKYNGDSIDKEGWLKTEFDTAQLQAFNARKWSKIEKQKETLPYLRYVAVTDEATCDICSPLDGITLPVDDAFWDEYYPSNHFNCRCLVEQLDVESEGEVTDDQDVNDATDASDEKMPDEFRMNAGKDEEIFKSDGKGAHPYFSVPKEYRTFAESNFGLDIPEED